MPNGIFQSTTIPIVQEAIQFSQSRHEVLAGNLANLDTPGYRIQDLSVDTFQERLKEAIEAQRTQSRPVSPGVFTRDPDAAMRQVREASRSILYHDDSDVGIEQQVLELSKNQFMHNMAISILSSQFQMLRAAISEQV